MRLKRLELVGFKSFANRVSLEFGRGITAIVGPNGSGKSNISDAVRWVLGEQSARTLRGSKMEDVIFSGSDGKKPLGMAEVQLTLDNSDGFLPVDFSEVTVTRRVYRSGESEFLINGKPCRLRDIQDLFTDTGLGKEGFAIIGQGQIDAVLSVRSQDRRVVLEETAGIVKYRLRKEEALQKIEQTNQDLIRVTDILRELDQRLGPLAKEAEKARRYHLLGEQLLAVEQDYYALELQRLDGERSRLEEERRLLVEATEKSAEEQARLERETAELEQNLHRAVSDLEESQARQFQLAEEQNSLETALNVKAERRRNNAQRMDTLAQLQEAKRLQLEGLQTERAAVLEELERALAECAAAEDVVEEAASALKATQEERTKLRRQLDTAKDDFFEFMRSLAELRNFQRDFAKEEQALTRQIAAKREAAAAAEEVVRQLRQQIREHGELQAAKLEETGRLRQDAEALQQEAQALATRAAAERERLRAIQARATQLQARLAALEDLESDYEGYTASVRHLMHEPKHKPLILGTVADILRVPAGLELAFEMALGPALQNVITPDEAAAQALIQWLKDRNAGRATFLPLEAMQPSRFPPAVRDALQAPGVLGTADELVECDPKFRPVVESLLGRIVITEDLDAAIALRRRLRQFSRIVTRDGSVVYPSGAMTGGSYTARTAGLLSRKAEIAQVQQQVAMERAAEAAQKQAVEEVEAAVAENRRRLDEIAQQQVNLQLEVQRLRQILDQLARDLAREEKQQALLESEAGQLAAAREALLARAETAAVRLSQAEAAEQGRRDGVQALEAKLREMEAEIERAQERLTLAKVGLTEAKSKAEALRMQLTTVDRQIGEAAAALEEAQHEAESLQVAQQVLAEEMAEAEARLELNLQAREALACDVDRLRQERDAMQDQLRVYGARLKHASSEHATVERKLYRNETELKLRMGEVERIGELLRERGLNCDMVRGRQPGQPKAQLKKAMDELREQIRSLGMVNPGAAEEYEQVKERHQFLTMQMNDLHEAKAQLQKAIAEMDEICRAKFLETFAQVRAEFSKLFTELFQGGKADLFLTEPESPLTTGIEVVAQPPGKKLQNLLLLSGGERALTAIALLFAIRRVKPTPFCILDEIDAALDETNLDRFARLMKEFAETTQLLTITHRQVTMEAADALYGVTMNDEAVSQIISVRMRQEG